MSVKPCNKPASHAACPARINARDLCHTFTHDTPTRGTEHNHLTYMLVMVCSPPGIIALGFSPDGIHLTAVASDNAHSVYVYDWRRGKLVESGRGHNGDPPQVNSVVAS